MKRFMSFIIFFLLFIAVEAKTTYNNVPNFANNYIKGYPGYQRYFVTKSTKYGFTNGADNNNKYKTGGLLNVAEFNVSGGTKSYLLNGLTFFTMTEESGEVNIIDPTGSGGISKINVGSAESGIRVTNYVKSGINVEGYGTRVSPWKVSQKFNVTFKYDDTKITVKPTSVTVTKGGYVIVDVIPSEQYTYKAQTTCGEIVDGKLRISGITKDMVCEIEYTYREYIVTIDAGKSKYDVEGVFNESISGQGWDLIETNKKATQKVSYEDNINNMPTSSQVQLEGYTLSGWSENNVAINPSTYKVTKDSTIKAEYSQNTYTITYVPHKGTLSTTTKTVTYDEKYGGLTTPAAPVGYTFTGWHLGSEIGQLVTEDTIVKTASNHELHGTWAAKTHTLTANANGGTISSTSGWTLGSGNTTATKTVAYDSAYGTLPTPTRSGYTFEGWHLNSESGSAVTSSTIVKTDGNHTIVAKWYTNIDVPRTSYCLSPTYNGTKQTIVSAASEGFTWVNHEQTDAGAYIVTAKIKEGYIWGGTDFADKTIECSIIKRNITVTASDQSKAYDGTALVADETCTSDLNLISGHTLTCASTGSRTNAGSSTKTLSTVTIKNGSVDVTNDYSITYITGSLSINRREITITAKDQTITYGTEISKTLNDITTATLVSGHSVTAITLVQSMTDVTTNGTITASNATVKNGSVDVTNNYSITYITGSLTINRREITIMAKNQSKTYDGSAILANDICEATSGSLLNGHTVICTCSGSQINAGNGTKTLNTVIIKNGSADVSSNYSITKSNGVLTIDKKAVVVSWSGSTEYTYDGDAHAPSASALTGISGETMSVTRTTATNAGSQTSTASCNNVSGGQAKCDNYNLTSNTKTFTINPVVLGAPSVTINKAGKVIWDDVANASSYQVSLDGGSWETALSGDKTISTSVDTHTASVRAVGSGNYATGASGSDSAIISNKIVVSYKKEEQPCNGSYSFGASYPPTYISGYAASCQSSNISCNADNVGKDKITCSDYTWTQTIQTCSSSKSGATIGCSSSCSSNYPSVEAHCTKVYTQEVYNCSCPANCTGTACTCSWSLSSSTGNLSSCTTVSGTCSVFNRKGTKTECPYKWTSNSYKYCYKTTYSYVDGTPNIFSSNCSVQSKPNCTAAIVGNSYITGCKVDQWKQVRTPCNGSYSLGATSTSTVGSCSNNTFTCNSSTVGSTYTICTANYGCGRNKTEINGKCINRT